MSTEARRASLPPRPAVPPRPVHPPTPPGTAPAEPAPQGRTSGGPGAFDSREPTHGTATVPRGRTPGAPGAPGNREPAGPPAGTADGRDGATGRRGRVGAGAGPDRGEPGHPPGADPRDGAAGAADRRGRTPGGSGAFESRQPANPSAGEGDGHADGPLDRRRGPAPAGADGSAPRPRFPRFGAGAHRDADSAPPPPPRASARFPDAPPTVGRGLRSPDAAPSVPAQPTHRPTAGRPGAPSETASETTTRLRPVPAEPAAGPSGTSRTPPAPPRPGPGPRPGSGEPHRSGAGPAHAPAGAPAPARRPATGDGATTGQGGRGGPDPALSWSAPVAPGGAPGPAAFVTFGEPEAYDERARRRPFGRRGRSQVVAAAACLVLGTGLIGGAVTGAWLAGDSAGPGARHGFTAAGDLWHNVPVDQLFPPTVRGKGAGPGEADRTWTRIAVAPDSGCEGAFDPLLRKVLDPVGCERLLRATYTDATQSHVTTVGLLFTEADAAGMASLARRFDRERLDRRTDLMPLPHAAKGTAAAGFGAGQRASWAVSVLTDAPVVVYAVSGWADGRTVDTPQPAEDAMESGATTAAAQAGLGHEARGLADRVERGLRKRAGTATERPS